MARQSRHRHNLANSTSQGHPLPKQRVWGFTCSCHCTRHPKLPRPKQFQLLMQSLLTCSIKRHACSACTCKAKRSPGSTPQLRLHTSASASVSASPKPRFTPWPASGCTECAASPTSASLGRTYLHALAA